MSNSGIALLGIGVVALVVLLFVGVLATAATVEQTERAIQIENESFEPVGDTVIELNNSALEFAEYNDTVTVRNATDGSVFEESGNYTWYDGNGTIEPVANSDLANASTATITYGYTGLSRAQTGVAALLADLQGLYAEFALLGGAVLTLGGLLVLGRAA